VNKKSVPLFSIVTIALNSENSIRRTIKSVISQTFHSFEYIIIDGGSTDGTLDILEEYKDQIKVISEPDKGISDAFNKGIKYSRGRFICFLNSDDWFEADILNKIAKYALDDIDILYGKLNLWYGDKYLYSQEANHTRLKFGMSLNHPSTFILKKVYANLLYNLNYKYAMDYDLLLKAYLYKHTFHYLDFSVANMSVEGVSNKYWFRTLKEVYHIKNKELNNKFMNLLYFLFSVIKSFLARNSRNLGLGFITKYYRRHISPIKKVNLNENRT